MLITGTTTRKRSKCVLSASVFFATLMSLVLSGCASTKTDSRASFAAKYGGVDFVRELGDAKYVRHVPE